MKAKHIIKDIIVTLLLAIAVFIIMSLTSCSHRTYPIAHHNTTDTIYRTNTQTIHRTDTIIQYRTIATADTILLHDSIIIIKSPQGEILHTHTYRNKERIKATKDQQQDKAISATHHTQVDTLYRTRTQYKEKPLIVHRPLRWYERIAIWVGIIALIMLACYLVVRFITRPVRL